MLKRIIPIILLLSIHALCNAAIVPFCLPLDTIKTTNSEYPTNWIKPITIQNPNFSKLFGGNTVYLIPKGIVDINIGSLTNRYENPFLNEKARKQWAIDFNENINLHITAKIGERAHFRTNFNTKSQFDFENQIRFDYIGKEDDIIKNIEIGTVNMPLNTSLIHGSESLFGIKARIEYRNFNLTSIYAQQKTNNREIVLNNGSQEGKIEISIADYEDRQHYFLAQYFRENYNQSLQTAPIINSGIQITHIEVWVTNNTNTFTHARDIIALIDLGEISPYNQHLITKLNSKLPSSGIKGQNNTELSNNLLQLVSNNPKSTNSLVDFFASSGGKDNYARLTQAKQLIENHDYTIHRKLGYLSLNSPLLQNQVLAVSYRYIYKGKIYQVGELSIDNPVLANTPSLLYTKLLQNEIIDTKLPTWDLMMKNIYRLQSSNIEKQNFDLQIYYSDPTTGLESPILYEGYNAKNKTWLEIVHLDRLTQNNAYTADGIFDWLPGITIDDQKGKLIFPQIAPFGKDLTANFTEAEDQLIEKYSFYELYQLTKSDVIQKYTNKNRFQIRGKYKTGTANEFYLGTFNLQPGTVRISTAGILLLENTDYIIDYTIGILTIINPLLLITGQPLLVTIENEAIFSAQRKTLLGARLDVAVTKNLAIGATLMSLSERPLTAKTTIGSESITNTLYGFDISYTKQSASLTKIVNKIPFLHTVDPSYIHMYGEFAKSITRVNSKGNSAQASYIDDFEGSFSYLDIKSAAGWQIAATPQHFSESSLINDLAYGYNRSLLAIYSIDPVFYQGSRSNPNVDSQYLIDNRSRRITEKEVFPLKEVARGTDAFLSTLDIAFYPMLRGPYNFSTTGIMSNGNFDNPTQKWGGIFKKIEQTDFEAQNIDYLEMWLMDPSLTNSNKAGGDMYINLGNISEDILKDGLKSIENGISPIGDENILVETVWGKIAKNTPIVQTFENNEQSRAYQDIGLDGLNNDQERLFYASFLTQLQRKISPEAYATLHNDPSTDDFLYFRGNHFSPSISILDRYKYFNGTQGNSRTAMQSVRDFGVANSAKTLLPDGEDLNRDNTMNETDAYYQYKLSTRKQDMRVGRNYIVEEQSSTVQIMNRNIAVKWYKIRIPLSSYQSKIGNIENFKNIRFVRIFLTNYADTTVLRLAKMQFVKGQWRRYNALNNAELTISDPRLGTAATDNSTIEISNINIEENSQRIPIPYVIPPGISRQIDYTNNNLAIQQNEQALSLEIKQLKEGYGRAVFKSANYDFRGYGRIEMYVHAEGPMLADDDVNVFLRVGTDDKYHYYEYEQPLAITIPGSTSPEAIWPEQNNLKIQLNYFREAKLARQNTNFNGLPWPIDRPFEYLIAGHKITVMGTPDLTQIKCFMIGIKNPLKDAISNKSNRNPVTGVFWFNELRLTDYDTKGGWSATVRMDLKLANFANIAITGRKSTIGFGTLSKRITDRNNTNELYYDISTNAELGKFFNPQYGIRIPFYFSFSKLISTPEYSPFNQDIKLNQSLVALNNKKQDSIRRIIQEYTTRRSFIFNNVRKLRTDTKRRIKPWDIENITLSYAYSEMQLRSYTIKANIHKSYRAILDYKYTKSTANYYKPFKGITNDKLAIFKDQGFQLLPTILNFRMDINRIYSENTFRNNSNNNILPTYYNKNFNINRIYGISWDITPSLRLDFNATNYAIVDDLKDRIDGIQVDTLWNNFWKLGRTIDYNHMLNITYNLPIYKIPYLDWINIYSRYAAQFNWLSDPFNGFQNGNINLGNSIQNNRTIQINPTLNLYSFYNKLNFIRTNNPNDTQGIVPIVIQLLTSIRHINAAYTQTQGVYIPGYLPQTNILGFDFKAKAPGIGFLVGRQGNSIEKAIINNWISTDTLFNQPTMTTYSENWSGIVHIEPIKNLKIDVTFSRVHNFNIAIDQFYDVKKELFQQGKANINGNYTISQIALRSSFRNSSQLYQEFKNYKIEISQELGSKNINSVGLKPDVYADGYSANQQDVIVNSFLDIFQRKQKTRINRKPTLPLPNWRLNYTGLIDLLSLENRMQMINISHAYQSQYIISAYQANPLLKEENGNIYSRDYQDNFSAIMAYPSIAIVDRFVPLIGINIRLKNAWSLNSEYRKSRDFNISLQNSLLAVQEEKSLIMGIGYRKTNIRLPLTRWPNKGRKNNINMKADFALNQRKTSIFREEFTLAEIAAGNKSISINPSIEYSTNRYYSIRIFYNSNRVQPYTSQNFITAYTYLGINLRLQFP